MDEFWLVFKQLFIGFKERMERILEYPFYEFRPTVIYFCLVESHCAFFKSTPVLRQTLKSVKTPKNGVRVGIFLHPPEKRTARSHSEFQVKQFSFIQFIVVCHYFI